MDDKRQEGSGSEPSPKSLYRRRGRSTSHAPIHLRLHDSHRGHNAHVPSQTPTHRGRARPSGHCDPAARRPAGHRERLRTRRAVPALERVQADLGRSGPARVLRRRPFLVPQPHRVGSRIRRGRSRRRHSPVRLRPRAPGRRPVPRRRHRLRGARATLRGVRLRGWERFGALRRDPLPGRRLRAVDVRHRRLHLRRTHPCDRTLRRRPPVARRPLDRLRPRREPVGARCRQRDGNAADPRRRNRLRLRRDPRRVLPGDHEPTRQPRALTGHAVVARLAPHRHAPLRRARSRALPPARSRRRAPDPALVGLRAPGRPGGPHVGAVDPRRRGGHLGPRRYRAPAGQLRARRHQLRRRAVDGGRQQRVLHAPQPRLQELPALPRGRRHRRRDRTAGRDRADLRRTQQLHLVSARLAGARRRLRVPLVVRAGRLRAPLPLRRRREPQEPGDFRPLAGRPAPARGRGLAHRVLHGGGA